MGVLGWLMVSSGWAQDSSPALEAFQQFVNGEIPVEEAVVYRRISRPDGELVNQDWFRFGFQGDSWFIQRLTPDPDNPANLLEDHATATCGASFKYLWILSQKDIHLAEKTFAAGSNPENYMSFPLNFMQHSVTLGLPLPHNGIGNIRWDGLGFTIRSVTGFSRTGRPSPTETNTIMGALTLGADGLPATAEYPNVNEFKGAVIRYEYNSTNQVLPAVFIRKRTGPDGLVFRWEFLSLKLGDLDLTDTGGYVPKMFADLSIPRTVTLWTNSLSYTLLNQELVPDFETSNPKRTGTAILGALGTTVVICLSLSYWRWKKSNATDQKEIA